LTSDSFDRSADPGEAEVAYSAGGSFPPFGPFFPPFLLSRIAKGISQTLGVFHGVRFPAMTHDFSGFAGAGRISAHPEGSYRPALEPSEEETADSAGWAHADHSRPLEALTV